MNARGSDGHFHCPRSTKLADIFSMRGIPLPAPEDREGEIDILRLHDAVGATMSQRFAECVLGGECWSVVW